MALATDLLELNVSHKNRRMKFYYVRMDSADHKNDYLAFLPILLSKAIAKPQSRPGKDLICLTCDQRPDILVHEVHAAVAPVVEEKGYVLFEQVSMPTSCFETVGLLYADIVGYLVSRVDTISNDEGLFDIPKKCFETDGRIRKLRSSTALISKIKKLSMYEVNAKA